jgi:hypothetical protein
MRYLLALVVLALVLPTAAMVRTSPAAATTCPEEYVGEARNPLSTSQQRGYVNSSFTRSSGEQPAFVARFTLRGKR